MKIREEKPREKPRNVGGKRKAMKKERESS